MPVKNIDITVDLTRPGVVNTQKELRYGDENNLRIAVTDGGNQVTLSSLGITTVDLVVSRLTGTPIDVVGSIVDDKAVFTLDGASLSVPGYTKATVQFYGADGSRVSTADFSFKSLADPSLNAVGDSTEQTIIQQVLVNGPEVIADAEAATIAANDKIVELDEVIIQNTKDYLTRVTAFADLATTYPTPDVGDTVYITSTGETVRYNGTQWIVTNENDPTAIGYISAQLDETESKVNDVALNVKDFGAKTDVGFDNIPALNDALTSMPVGGTLLIPSGTFEIGSEWVVNKQINLIMQGKLKFTGTGTAVTLSCVDSTIHNLNVTRDFQGIGNVNERLLNNGVRFWGVKKTKIYNPVVQGFSNGFIFDNSDGKSNAYIDIYSPKLSNNKIGYNRPNVAGLGWTNEINVFGGGIEISSGYSDYVGSKLVNLEGGDCHRFNNVSLESTVVERKIYCNGVFNTFKDCRFEGTNGILDIELGVDSKGNSISGRLANFQKIIDQGKNNEIQDSDYKKISGVIKYDVDTEKVSGYIDTFKVYEVDCSDGDKNISVPTATSTLKGAEIIFIKKDNTTNKLFIAPQSSDMLPVNGFHTRKPYAVVRLFCDGTKWRVLQGEPTGVLAWTVGTVSANSFVASPNVPVLGAKVGDFTKLASPINLVNCIAFSHIFADGFARITIYNPTASPVSFANEGVWKVSVDII